MCLPSGPIAIPLILVDGFLYAICLSFAHLGPADERNKRKIILLFILAPFREGTSPIIRRLPLTMVVDSQMTATEPARFRPASRPLIHTRCIYTLQPINVSIRW